MARTRAIVIGGSMAGLCAAAALRRSFDEVTLIERDAYPEGVGERAGVPQARHVHALLTRGWIELDRLFPGFQARMRAAGVQELDSGLDFASLRRTGWQGRLAIRQGLYLMTRNQTEAIVRGLLRETAVEVRERIEVTGLLGSRGGRARVTGVTARARDGGAQLQLSADLVVDASGRGSRAPAWLEALGVRAPEESEVDSFAGYSSRWFRRPDASRWPAGWWWKGAWVDPDPPRQLMGGALFPVEGDRWICTLFGFSRQYPPTDDEGFSRALRALRSPVIAEAVALGEPISPVYATRSMSNRYRHYERMPDRVEGFTALGDSACVYNPIYGQGMTVSALCARALEETVAQVGPSNPALGRAFSVAQAKVFAAPWALAAGNDLRFPATVGKRAPIAAFLKVYTDALGDACLDDEEIHRRAMEVFYMLKPAHGLFAPDLVARVVAGAVRRRLRELAGGAVIPAMPPAS